MSAVKVILIVLGVLTALGMGSCFVCTAIIGGAASEVAENIEEEKKVQEKAAEGCKDETAVEWAKIAAELKENEAKVVKKWKGKCQKVSGFVSSIDSGINDQPIVIVKGATGGFDLNSLRCTPADDDKALELKKGAEITVWGLGGDELMGSLRLSHCDW